MDEQMKERPPEQRAVIEKLMEHRMEGHLSATGALDHLLAPLGECRLSQGLHRWTAQIRTASRLKRTTFDSVGCAPAGKERVAYCI